MYSSSDKIVVRGLSKAELPALGLLWESAGLSVRLHGRDAPDQLRVQWEACPAGFLGAFDRDKLVGVVLATDDGRRGWINRLAVLPAYRGKGIGMMLIEAGERVLKQKGLRIIAALIDNENDASRSLFAKAGYELLPGILYYSKRESPDV